MCGWRRLDRGSSIDLAVSIIDQVPGVAVVGPVGVLLPVGHVRRVPAAAAMRTAERATENNFIVDNNNIDVVLYLFDKL